MAYALLLIFVLGTLALATGMAQRGLPLIFSLHLVLIALMFGGYELVALPFGDHYFRAETLLFQLLLLCLYVGLVAIIGFRGRRHDVLEGVENVPSRWLIGAMVAMLLLKVYLVTQYGLSGLSVLRDRDLASIETWEVLADTLLFYPAVGAFWLATVRVGRGGAGLTLGLMWVAFWIWPLVGFGEIGGARRFAISTFALLGLAVWSRRHYRISLQAVMVAVGTAGAIVAVSFYFQAIRANLDDPQIARVFASGDVTTALTLYLTPPPRAVESFTASVSDRMSPLLLLYELNAMQLERPKVAGGRLIRSSLENAVPRFLFPTKEYVDSDEVLSAIFGFPFIDLPTSIIAAGQAEMLWIAYLAVPVVVGLLLIGYSRLFRWASGRVPLLAIATWAVLVRCAVTIEQGPDFMLNDVRHLAAFGVLAGAYYGAQMVRRSLRASPDASSSTARAQNTRQIVAPWQGKSGS